MRFVYFLVVNKILLESGQKKALKYLEKKKLSGKDFSVTKRETFVYDGRDEKGPTEKDMKLLVVKLCDLVQMIEELVQVDDAREQMAKLLTRFRVEQPEIDKLFAFTFKTMPLEQSWIAIQFSAQLYRAMEIVAERETKAEIARSN